MIINAIMVAMTPSHGFPVFQPMSVAKNTKMNIANSVILLLDM